jgi:hypothetical protein
VPAAARALVVVCEQERRLPVGLISQTEIATLAIVGIALFALGAVLLYFMGQRK